MTQPNDWPALRAQIADAQRQMETPVTTALPQTIDSLFEACEACANEDCNRISHQLIYLAELVDEECAEGYSHGSFIRDEAKRVADLEGNVAALARMLADEQAAHTRTCEERDAWQSLATQRQQETEAALARMAKIRGLVDSMGFSPLYRAELEELLGEEKYEQS